MAADVLNYTEGVSTALCYWIPPQYFRYFERRNTSPENGFTSPENGFISPREWFYISREWFYISRE